MRLPDAAPAPVLAAVPHGTLPRCCPDCDTQWVGQAWDRCFICNGLGLFGRIGKATA